jgi:hypothetical protein
VLGRLRGITPQGQTFLAGLAGWDGQEASDQLIARADRALYAAKANGHDRVTVDRHHPAARPRRWGRRSAWVSHHFLLMYPLWPDRSNSSMG